MLKDKRLDPESGKKVTVGGMIVNVILTVLKFLGGIFGGSKALLADALHSLSDLVSDFLALVGLHYYRKGKDSTHPYGHGKIESLSTMGIGMILIGAALWIGIDAARTIYSRDFTTPHVYTIWIAGLSIFSKEFLYQATARVARRIRSDVLAANAWHHRSDAITSVVSITGITLARFVPGLIFLDSYAAILVSFFIIRIGVEIIRKAVGKIIDAALPAELIAAVSGRIGEIEGVIGVHDITGRYYAASITMEAHVEVDPEITVRCAHDISNLVEKSIVEDFDDITSVLVHIDPHIPEGTDPAAEEADESGESRKTESQMP